VPCSASQQLGKAAGILEHVPTAQALPYWRRLAGGYEAAGQLQEAETAWLRAGAPMDAVDMHTRAGGVQRTGRGGGQQPGGLCQQRPRGGVGAAATRGEGPVFGVARVCLCRQVGSCPEGGHHLPVRGPAGAPVW